MFVHLHALVPSQRATKVCRQGAEEADEAIANMLSTVLRVGDVQQHDRSSAALDEGSDRRLVRFTNDQISLPCSEDSAVFYGRRPVSYQGHVLDSATPLNRLPTPFPSCPARSDGRHNATGEGVSGARVQRLVDRLVRDTHHEFRWIVTAQPAGDLFG